jgi:hypothetical protein
MSALPVDPDEKQFQESHLTIRRCTEVTQVRFILDGLGDRKPGGFHAWLVTLGLCISTTATMCEGIEMSHYRTAQRSGVGKRASLT